MPIVVARLIGAEMTGAELTGAELTGAELIGAPISFCEPFRTLKSVNRRTGRFRGKAQARDGRAEENLGLEGGPR